jgi:hypothetical protein
MSSQNWGCKRLQFGPRERNLQTRGSERVSITSCLLLQRASSARIALSLYRGTQFPNVCLLSRLVRGWHCRDCFDWCCSVAEDAESRMTACSRCDGTGKVNDAIPVSEQEPIVRVCPVCEGTRKMRVIGDNASRDLVFESIGLTGKKGPTIAIQQNFGLASELGDVLMTSQKIITGGNE